MLVYFILMYIKLQLLFFNSFTQNIFISMGSSIRLIVLNVLSLFIYCQLINQLPLLYKTKICKRNVLNASTFYQRNAAI